MKFKIFKFFVLLLKLCNRFAGDVLLCVNNERLTPQNIQRLLEALKFPVEVVAGIINPLSISPYIRKDYSLVEFLKYF